MQILISSKRIFISTLFLSTGILRKKFRDNKEIKVTQKCMTVYDLTLSMGLKSDLLVEITNTPN